MPSTTPVLLLLGYGANVGQSVARSFAAKGYKVALTSRKADSKDDTANQISVAADLSKPESIAGIFSKVKASIGTPSVVVYNASSCALNDAKDPLSLSLADFTKDQDLNVTSAFLAAQQATLGFAQLPDTASKTFIYTGNILNEKMVIPRLMDSAIGKSAASRFIHYAALAYAERGFKFYFADERKPDGAPAYMDIDGKAHGEYYLQLSEHQEQGPWQQTFVKDVWYKEFPSL